MVRFFHQWKQSYEFFSFGLLVIGWGRNVLGYRKYFILSFCNFAVEFYWDKA